MRITIVLFLKTKPICNPNSYKRILKYPQLLQEVGGISEGEFMNSPYLAIRNN
jgi:hypothetical protein